ncbi:unnamed protein product [Adineta steineri]|uniref:Homeobox domain-containing protein n=1 Tax=Adineta steineri TaxID=433720 RepID=A0A814VS32_9BILA|nr:unnamed protein product [Adineta steineri]
MDLDNGQPIPDKKSCVTESDIIKTMFEFKRVNSSVFAWEIQDRLVNEMNCKLEDVPSISSIDKILKNLGLPENSNSKDKHQIDNQDSEEYKKPITKDDLNENDLRERVNVQHNQTLFTQKQKDLLEEVFNVHYYPDISQREKLALKFNVPEVKIQIWFQNRRREHRKVEKVKIRQQAQPKLAAPLLAEDEFYYFETFLLFFSCFCLISGVLFFVWLWYKQRFLS